MSVSAIFGVRITATVPSAAPTILRGYEYDGPKSTTVIECSSRPKKKATSHHMKTRPKKTQPWDIKRKPTVYPPLPPLPPDWTLLSSCADDSAAAAGAGDAATTAETLVSTGS